MKNFYSIFAVIICLFLITKSDLHSQWVSTGGPENGDIRNMIFTPEGNLFAGVGIGGVYISTNSGTNWSAANTGISTFTNQALITRQDGNFIFAGFPGGTTTNGVYRSSNNGTSWTRVISGMWTRNVQAMTVTPTGSHLFAGTSSGGVFRSTNDGTDWDEANTGFAFFNMRALGVSPDGSRIFAGPVDGVYYSTDNGNNWTFSNTGITNNFINAFAFMNVGGGYYVFAGTEDGVFLSTNNGVSWSAVNNGLTQTWIRALSVSGSYIFAATNSNGVFMSSDYGANWTNISEGLTGDDLNTRALAVSGDYLFTGTFGNGVFRRPLSELTSNPNFGSNNQSGDNLYFFANSTAQGSGSPSQPTFSWRDTTGSTSLVVNRTNVSTFGAGNLDDGRYDITGQLPPGHAIKFFGTDYTNLYIGTNGIIGFAPFTPTFPNFDPPASGLNQGEVTNAIFPLWIDINFGSVTGPAENRLSYKITADEVIITYDNAYIFGGVASTFVSFQVIIKHSVSPTQNSLIIVQYNDATTGSDFIDRYENNTLRTHLVGLQAGNSASEFLQYRFRNGSSVVTPGPLFGSPLAVAFGPDENALPVDLVSFSAYVNNRDVILNWVTAWEENNNRFDVQRRQVGSNWQTVGTVAGAGTSYQQTNYSFTDKNLQTGKYEYRLVQFDHSGQSTADFDLNQTIEIGVPLRFDLSQNYPNPFNPVTKIGFEIPVEGFVKLSVFDLSGREVAVIVNDRLSAGYYTADFNGSVLASGVYLYRLVAGNTVITKKMTLVK